jgi:four helix bundle protein
MDYKASKAWHIGHDLAADIRQLAEHLSANKESDLADTMLHLATMAPQKIAESLDYSLQHEKLKAYRVARAAVKELQEHISLARDLHYIDHEAEARLAAKAIAIYRLLSALIQSSKRQTTTD